MTDQDRDQRLAAKLRENLRRRKAQAKARDAEGRTRAEGGEDDRVDGEDASDPDIPNQAS